MAKLLLQFRVKILLCDLKLALQYRLPQVPVDLSWIFGDFGQTYITVRITLAVKVMICLLVELPAVMFAEAFQIFPAWHRMLSPIFSVSPMKSALKTYGI